MYKQRRSNGFGALGKYFKIAQLKFIVFVTKKTCKFRYYYILLN